jgi:hypothetical protein
VLFTLNAALLAGYWFWCIRVWTALPAEIPGHFGATGQVTRWDATTPASWFGLTVIGTLTAGLPWLLGRFAHRYPGSFNMASEQKERLLALPAEPRKYALEPMRVFLYLLAMCMLLLFFFLQTQIYRTAHGGEPGGLLLLAVLLFGLGPLLGIPWMTRAMQRRTLEAEGGAV